MNPLPHNTEAEMALLGSLLLRPCPETAEAMQIVSPGMFHSPIHSDIYAVIARSPSADFDLVTLHAELSRNLPPNMTREELGDYLVKLAEGVPSPVNAPHYAKLVRSSYRRRELMGVCEEVLHECGGSDDTDDVLSRAFERVARVCDAKPESDIRLEDAMELVRKGLYARDVARYETGIEAFDREAGGVWARGINTVLGVPSSGKSSFVFGTVLRAAVQHGVGAAIFSYEMSPESVAKNILSQVSGVNVGRLSRDRLSPDSEQEIQMDAAIEFCRDRNIHIVEEHLNADQIFARSRYYKSIGVHIRVIDYIQHLPLVRHSWSQVENIQHTMDICRRMAREHSACVMAVSQITKGESREPRPPNIFDGLGAGAIEQRSDMMIGVYRPCVWEDATQYAPEAWRNRRREAVLNVVKDKQGSTFAVETEFIPEESRFGNPHEKDDFHHRNGQPSQGFRGQGW